MEKVPEFTQEVAKDFKSHPPTFFWYDERQKIFKPYLSQYQPMMKDGKVTPLYVTKEKVKQLNKAQLERLAFFNFSF